MDTAHSIAAAAACGFPVFECHACAENIRKALIAAGVHGQLVELRTRREKYKFIICLSYQDGQTTITETGRHVGIRVGDVVFDNLHPDGMRYDNWVHDFDAWPGVEVSVVAEF
jgi:hypothetical protein